MKKSIKEILKKWDEDQFDLTKMAAGDMHPKTQELYEPDESWAEEPVTSVDRRLILSFQKLYPVAAVLLLTVLIIFLMNAVSFMPAFGAADTPANNSETIRRYIEDGLKETGAVNIVAGVILDYRAFDTLGESHVLFTAAICVFILMLSQKELKEKETDRTILQDDPILKNTARVLAPFIILFGFYVILNGHLGPGGGFSGGAIIGGGLILSLMAFGPDRMHQLLTITRYRMIVLISLMFYSLSKCYSFFCGANHYETIFSPGTPGKIFSAGLILPLNLAVGLVVACTMYGFFAIFTRDRI